MSTVFEIQGQRLELPMRIPAARAAGGVFGADLDAVDAALPEGLRAVACRPGRAAVLVIAVDYLDNPLGTYDELVVAPLARVDRPGPIATVTDLLRGRVGIFVAHMPVSEEFTCEAGRTIWGYPKTVDELDFDLTADVARARWARDGEVIVQLAGRTGGRLQAPWGAGTTYTAPGSDILRTPLRSRMRGAGVRAGGARLRLGPGASRVGLDAWGLGERALVSFSADHIEMAFEEARPLRSDA